MSGRNQIMKIINSHMDKYLDTLERCEGNVDRVMPENLEFRDQILLEISSNETIIQDIFTGKIINPNGRDKELDKHIQKDASKSNKLSFDCKVNISLGQLNNTCFSRFEKLPAYQLGHSLEDMNADKDGRNSTLSCLFGLVQNKKMIKTQKGGGWTIVIDKKRNILYPQSGQHRTLACYLLGVTEFEVQRCIEIG